MDKQKKTLLFMYVDNFCGIKEESFNFYIKRRYRIKQGEINRKRDEEIIDFPTDFWGDNVSAVTLFIGENGAGKTTLMRLLIKWLCQLSVGHIPQEKGALVINVDDEDKLIAFDQGKTWTIKIHKIRNIECMEDINEIKELLGDIRLAYYTDTTTDLELSDTLTAEELAFLQDDSLLTRISNSMKGRYTVDSIKDCIKRKDFERQMKFFLYSKDKENADKLKLFLHSEKEEDLDIMSEFSIRYMKFTAIKVGDEKNFKKVSDGNDSLIGEVMDLWNKVVVNNTNNSLPDIVRALLWGIFSGTITSLLQWERTLPNLEECIVSEQVRSSLRAFIRANYSDWNIVFNRFFTNMFGDCERRFNDKHRYEEFHTVWEHVVDNIIKFLGALKKFEKGEFLNKWMPSENAQYTWEFKLEHFNKKNEKGCPILMQDWEYLWEHYLAVAHLMPKCRFDWKYVSSGGKNKSNLCTNLFNIVDKCKGSKPSINQLWFFLDEPDNTFHPDWKRRIIRELLDICSIFNKNFQLLISTHSPIMLSDVPKQAAILLQTVEEKQNGNKAEKKQQRYPKSSPFGQQIYTLFNDAFFMEQGIIGAFADKKIENVYKGLYDFEEQLSKREKIQDENKLKEYESIIKLIEEPLLHGHLSQSYKLCKQRSKGLS